MLSNNSWKKYKSLEALLQFSCCKTTLSSKNHKQQFFWLYRVPKWLYFWTSVIQADFDHFYLCSTFYYLMSSYNKKKSNAYIFKNRYHSTFILFLWGRRWRKVIFLLCFEQNCNYQHSFAFLLFCISGFLSASLRDVRAEHKHKPIVVESPEETRTFFG